MKLDEIKDIAPVTVGLIRISLLLVLLAIACCAALASEGVKVLASRPVQARGVNLAVIADGRLSDAHGWGVPIKRNGNTVILTALHVLMDASTLEVRPARVCVDGTWHVATLLKTDAENDLALLRIDCAVTPIDVQPVEKLEGARMKFVQMHVPGCLPGWSGSGVLDIKGRLAAIIIRSQAFNAVPVEGEALVVPASVIAEFLRQ